MAFTRSRGTRTLSCYAAFRVFHTRNGQVPRETPGLGGHAVFGTRVGLVAESSANIGLDRLRGGAYIVIEGQSLFVLCCLQRRQPPHVPEARQASHILVLQAIERERRKFLWTSAPCTLSGFNFAMTCNTKLMGSTVFDSLATLFLSIGLHHAALCFSVLGGSLGFCLQLF